MIYRDPAEGARDDEIDFVLVPPERGIVCLEVKGGGIECRHGEWFRLDRAAASASGSATRSPRRSTTATRSSARSPRSTAGRRDELFLVHALAFPDITVHQLVLGARRAAARS